MHYAAKLFSASTVLQPYAYQGWLEWAKLCEESGDAAKCKELLSQGLYYCPENDNLIVKSIKVHERDNESDKIRKLLKSDQWRVKVESALFEGRMGNHEQASKIFDSLCLQVANGPVYLEASRYQEREGDFERALDYCEEGLDYNPKYAPLWFQYLRLYEKVSQNSRETRFDDFQTMMNDLHANVSRELEWKVHVEAAQCLERLGSFDKSL